MGESEFPASFLLPTMVFQKSKRVRYYKVHGMFVVGLGYNSNARISIWCWFCLVVSTCWIRAASAESYNAYQYDMTLPQFTPDGRLLQLEYARLAAGHSAPIMALRLSSLSSKMTGDKSEPPLLALVTYRPSFRLQERLVVLDDNTHGGSNAGASSTTKSSIMVGFAGVIADCGALGRKVQEASMQHEQMFGTPFSTAQQWAMSVSQYCQIHALGGGIRPFGASLVVAECSPNHSRPIRKDQRQIENDDGRTASLDAGSINIFITDPSGAVQTINGMGITSPTVLVGGDFMRETKLKRDLVSRWPDILAKYDTPAKRLAGALQLMNRAVSETAPGDESKNKKKIQDDVDDATCSDLVFEVVLLSPEKGIFKLTPTQMKAVLAQTLQVK